MGLRVFVVFNFEFYAGLIRLMQGVTGFVKSRAGFWVLKGFLQEKRVAKALRRVQGFGFSAFLGFGVGCSRLGFEV